MSSGFREFLLSAAVVGVGLTGLWAWPIIADDGPNGLITRVVEMYHKSGARLRPAVAILAGSPDGAAAPDLQPAAKESQAPAPRIEPVRLAAAEPVVPAQCDAASPAIDAAVIGDRLQLRIFETSVLAGAPGSQAAPSTTDIVFERLDLSGAYEIGISGAISIPAIGHVDVAGHSLSCIEALVSRQAFERMRTGNTVSAAYAARPPILVRGAVRAPGPHSYSPGLTVERVLAQSGAGQAHDPASSTRIVALEARRRELERTRAGLGLERMRLEAAMAGKEFLPEEALTVTKAVLGEERVDTERAALAAEIVTQLMRQVHTAEHLKDLDARIEAAQRQLEIAQTHFDYFDHRRQQQAEFLKSRVITESHLDSTAIKAMQAEQVLLEKQESLLRLQTERHLAINNAALADAERQSALAAELRSLTARSEALENEYQAINAELEVLRDNHARLAVMIERPTGPEGTQTIVASPSTLVRPGDLVTVSPMMEQTEKSARLEARNHPLLVRSAQSQ